MRDLHNSIGGKSLNELPVNDTHEATSVSPDSDRPTTPSKREVVIQKEEPVTKH